MIMENTKKTYKYQLSVEAFNNLPDIDKPYYKVRYQVGFKGGVKKVKTFYRLKQI